MQISDDASYYSPLNTDEERDFANVNEGDYPGSPFKSFETPEKFPGAIYDFKEEDELKYLPWLTLQAKSKKKERKFKKRIFEPPL